jgi:hypothetical protein
MHEGESFYVFNWVDYGTVLAFVLIWAFLQYREKLPPVASFRDFVNIWNSRGGNILVLLALTIYSLRISMRLIYHFVALISEGKIDEKSAIIMVSVSWLTGGVFGLFAGALIKTMTGSEGGTPVPPTIAPEQSSSVSTVTSATSSAAPPVVHAAVAEVKDAQPKP